MTKTDNFEKVEVASAAELRTWLEANHEQDDSVWLVTYKKHMGEKYVSTQQILDEVLCFGWIDGIRRKLDDDRTMQLIAPRKTQHWARSYKDRVAKLEAEGRMHPAGLRVIEESKQNGLWNFMDDVDALIIPEDLAATLTAHPPAMENFENAAPSYRRNVLRWIKLAKTEKTRIKRLEKTADFAARDEKIPQM
ncbi:MAG: YdeI/OmpD-associated family protein [Chloroflexota bacterium]